MGGEELLKIKETGFGWFSLFIKGEELATSKCLETIAMLASSMLVKEGEKIANIQKSQPSLGVANG
jgi:hypothetical protein